MHWEVELNLRSRHLHLFSASLRSPPTPQCLCSHHTLNGLGHGCKKSLVPNLHFHTLSLQSDPRATVSHQVSREVPSDQQLKKLTAAERRCSSTLKKTRISSALAGRLEAWLATGGRRGMWLGPRPEHCRPDPHQELLGSPPVPSIKMHMTRSYFDRI